MIDPDLDIFAKVAEAGSIAAAARLLRISAPMVSRRLARLEARLGVTLASRTTRRLMLTAQGERFYRDVVALLSEWQHAEARVMNSVRVASGPLRINAPTSFGRLYVAPMVKPFLERYPEVRLTLDLSDNFVNLIESRFDLAIRITGEVPVDARSERLAGSARVLCAAPVYLVEHGTPRTMNDISQHRILAAEGQLPWRLVKGRKAIMLPGASHVTTNSSEVVRELALAGMGIALRSLWDIHADLAAGRLCRVLANVEGSLDVGIYAIRPSDRIAPAAVEAFIGYLRHLLQPKAPWEQA